jgi:hypothetical protein
MSKPSKRKKRKAIKMPSMPPKVLALPTCIPIWLKASRKIWSFVGAFCLVVGIYAILPYAYRVSFPVTDSIDGSQPLDGPFVLKNDGWLSLYDLKVNLKTERMIVGGFTFEEGIEVSNIWSSPLLLSGDSGTFGLSDKHISITPMPPNVVMHLNVTYRPEWFWWRTVKDFSFHTRKASDGTVRWYPGIPNNPK